MGDPWNEAPGIPKKKSGITLMGLEYCIKNEIDVGRLICIAVWLKC